MAGYRATTDWRLGEGEDFAKGRYSRGHSVVFGGGHAAPGTASAHVIGNRWSVPGAVDPEEMLVASISACHLLTFLHLAAKARIDVVEYEDRAEAEMPEDEEPVRITRISLRPRIVVASDVPEERVARLCELAHERCYVANSLKSEVTLDATIDRA